jgi:thiamine-monophosphate kinase
MVRELELLRWVAERAPIGDDCAVLDCGPWGRLLVTTDSVIDGVHARWGVEGPGAFGYKAIARGLSDVAAMGGEPLWAFLAVCLPHGVKESEAKALFLGAERAGCPLMGGDTAFGPTAYAVGTVLGRAHPKGPALRSNARPGDWILVTGPLGGSLASGKHCTFTPRVREARELMDHFDVGGMIDVSDGLSTDLTHVLRASKVGCRLEAASIPRNSVPLRNALDDGEDFELLATVRPDPEALARFPNLFRIGTITAGAALLVHPDGREEPLQPQGYEHGD